MAMSERLRVCAFKGTQNLPLYVAQEQGFFAARDLVVELTYTAGSAAQFTGLARGEYDLIQTAPDNVINAASNPAALGLDPAQALRITMLMGGSTGPLALYAQPSIATPDDLRGATLGVDNPGSGFALVLRDMLARAGLLLGRDYGVTEAGGTSARLDALQSGSVAATILYAPYDALAAEQGFRRLAGSTDYYAAYASLATAGAAEWVEAHAATVTGYIAAILRALRWIYQPANAAARLILQREPSLALDERMAARAYAAFVDPVHGFGRDARLSDAGLQQVIDLRVRYGDATFTLGTPTTYRDLRWYRRARAPL
jgi:ABC-type nitrate/sulfonate/bicarbonate transport system substrate-binding protein